ncbi:MAG: HAD-IIA family hydrolase [Saccharofermentanales bacterium]
MALVYSSKIGIGDTDRINSDLSRIKCWLLDMDGTVSLGEKMIPGAERFFEALGGSGRYIFLTNNSSHSASHYLTRLRNMGIHAGRDEVLISTDALIRYLFGTLGEDIRVFCVGTSDFEKDLQESGITIEYNMGKEIDAVLVGFDTSLTYSKLNIACDYIRSGVPWFAANPDKVCPLEGGKVLPDCGAIISFLKTCTDTEPVKVIGKPETAMVDMVIDKYGFDRSEIAMVGDRIYTDLAVALNSGIMSIAVLTGEASLDEILSSGVVPDHVFENIGDIAGFISHETV